MNRTIRFLTSRGVTREVAADIAQFAWLRGWEKLSQLRDETRLVTWVNSIALNHYRRMLHREPPLQELQDTTPDKAGVNLAAIEVSRIFDRCEPTARALLKAQIEGITADEMARKEGVSPTAIRLRFLRARRSARIASERGRREAAASCSPA